MKFLIFVLFTFSSILISINATITLFTLKPTTTTAHAGGLFHGNVSALLAEDKERYHQLIQKLWKGEIKSTPQSVTKTTVSSVDQALDQIKYCADRLKVITELGALAVVHKFNKENVKKFFGLINQFIGFMMKSKKYKECPDQAAANWKSVVKASLDPHALTATAAQPKLALTHNL